MRIMRAVVHVVMLVLVDMAIIIVVGGGLLLAYAAWRLLIGDVP